MSIQNRPLFRAPMTPMHVAVPGWAALFVIHHPNTVVDGRRVVFVKRDPRVIALAQNERRVRTVLAQPRQP